MLEGLARIAAERRRQIEEEGWTPEHDAEHELGELADAAACYAAAAAFGENIGHELAEVLGPPEMWPWSPDWWKPSEDPIRNLEKAGALIAAEIDRVLREQEESDV